MQSRHDRHLEITQQLDDEAAPLSPENAVFMLEADHIHLVKVAQIGRQAVFVQLTLVDLAAHLRRVRITFWPVVHRDRPTGFVRCVQGDGFKQVRGECGDTTQPGEVVTDEDDRFERLPPWSWVNVAKILCRLTDLADSVVFPITCSFFLPVGCAR